MNDFDINQESDNNFESTPVLVVGVGEDGNRAAAIIAKDFNISGLRTVLADKMLELFRIRLSNATRINLDTEWREDYRQTLQGVFYAFLLVKLGGEMETNTIKIMAKVTSEMNVPFVIFAQMPITKFTDESELRAADAALENLKGLANAVVVISSDALFETIPNNLPVDKAYERATEWFAEAVASIVRPFSLQNVTNTNASRLEWLIKRKNSTCTLGVGWGDGPNATDEAIEQLVQSPFLRRTPEDPAIDAALVILSVAPEISLEQAHQTLKQIKGLLDNSIQLTTGICVDDSLAEGIRISALLRSADTTEKDDSAKPSAEPAKKKNSKKTSASQNQMMLNLFVEQNLGIFSAKEPTKYGGDNLDLPTYSRLNLYIDRD